MYDLITCEGMLYYFLTYQWDLIVEAPAVPVVDTPEEKKYVSKFPRVIEFGFFWFYGD